MFARRHSREISVSLDAQSGIGDVTCRNERGHARLRSRLDEFGFVRRDKIEPQLHLDARPGFLALQLRDGLFQQLTIQIEPDRHDMATLGRAENAARAANLEIAHRDAKPRA